MRNFTTYADELVGKELIDQINEEEPGVLVVSNSQLASWNRCEFNWYLGYHQGWTQIQEKSYLRLGSLGHECLALWYKTKDRGLVVELLGEHFNEWAFKSDEMLPLLAEETWLILRYIDDWTPSVDAELEEVEAVEEHFTIALQTPTGRKFYLQGYVDVRALMRGGGRFLWDHKFSGRFMSRNQVAMDPQLSTYAAAFDLYGVPVVGVIYNQLNTYEYKDKSKVPPEKIFKREPHYISKTQMANTLREVGNAVDDMYNKREAGAVPRRRLSRDCGNCWFQDPCLMGLQGHDINQIMLVDYKKKGELGQYEEEETLDGVDFDF